MASLDWECRRADGVTLVELLVTSDTPERARIESTIEPVWPPRRQGRPTAGWEENTFEGIVSAGSALAVGYASPAEPSDPPAVIATTTAAERTDGAGTRASSTSGDVNRQVSQEGKQGLSARSLARALGESGPPRDAVPVPSDEGTETRDRSRGADPTPRTANRTPESGAVRQTDSAAGECPARSWFEAVERRLDRAEQLAAVETVQEAQAAVEAAGGLDAVRTLTAEIRADRRALQRLEQRHGEVTDRIERVEIPLDTLERLT